MSHGVRKVNEFVVRDGRALLMTQNVATGITQAQWDSIADGTIYIAPATGDIKYKNIINAPKEWTKFLPGNIFDINTISNAFLVDKTVQEGKMNDNSISTRTIIDRNVTSPKIAKEAILTEHFAVNSLDGSVVMENTLDGSKVTTNTLNGSKVADRSLEGVKLVQGTVSDLELGIDSVRTQHIKNENVTEAKLSANSVTRSKIKDLEIITSKYADNSITNAKLAENSVDWKNICTNGVRTSHILDLNVTSDKLSKDSVIENKILDGAVTELKIGEKQVTNSRIADSTIQKSKLATDIQTVISNAVFHDKGIARVYGALHVDGNIVASKTDLTQRVEGFRVFNPVFADYAEGFVVTEPVEEGDIVEVDKFGCVKKAEAFSRKIVGIVSERYGLCLDASNEELRSGAKTAVGLMGKVPVKVVGKIKAGDFIVSSGDGIGMAISSHKPGSIVGKALEDKDTYGLGTVLCLIQPM